MLDQGSRDSAEVQNHPHQPRRQSMHLFSRDDFLLKEWVEAPIGIEANDLVSVPNKNFASEGRNYFSYRLQRLDISRVSRVNSPIAVSADELLASAHNTPVALADQ